MKKTIFTFLLSLLITACGTSEKSTVKETESSSQGAYVFDNPSEEDTSEVIYFNIGESNIKEQKSESAGYIVQLGAFSKEENAKRFVLMKKEAAGYPLDIIYDDGLKYYLVQIRGFANRKEADDVKAGMLTKPEFDDIYIKVIEE